MRTSGTPGPPVKGYPGFLLILLTYPFVAFDLRNPPLALGQGIRETSGSAHPDSVHGSASVPGRNTNTWCPNPDSGRNTHTGCPCPDSGRNTHARCSHSDPGCNTNARRPCPNGGASGYTGIAERCRWVTDRRFRGDYQTSTRGRPDFAIPNPAGSGQAKYEYGPA
jgi:hypothetical protein